MNEVQERINELERLHEVSRRHGLAVPESWLFGELVEMKAILKREKALAGTRTR